MKKGFLIISLLMLIPRLAFAQVSANTALPNLDAKATPVGADIQLISDSADSNYSKRSTIAQILTDANIPDTITVDLATEATDLAANGGNCSAGEYPLGVDTKAAVEDCTDATTEIDSAILTHKNIVAAHHTQGALELTNLSDVGAATASVGRLLVADGTDFESVAMGGSSTIAPDGTMHFRDLDASFTIISGTVGNDNVPLTTFRKAYTLTDFYCRTSIAASTMTIHLSDGTNDTDDVVCDFDGQEDDGTIANNTFTALEHLEYDTVAVSGDPTYVNFTFTRDE